LADSGLRTHAIKLVGVRSGIEGGFSVVGVAVPESGYAGDGAVECAFEREDRIPDNIAMPSVPRRDTVSCERAYLDLSTLTTA
jgi:hypothetical protein